MTHAYFHASHNSPRGSRRDSLIFTYKSRALIHHNCFTCGMDHYDGNDDNDNYSHWIVQHTEDQGYEPIAESSVIRRQRIFRGKKHEELPQNKILPPVDLQNKVKQGETECLTFDLNKLPEEASMMPNIKAIGDHSGGKVSLRSDDYDIDLNRLPYNDYLNGPTFEDMFEEEKQLRWKLMKG